MNLMGDRMFPYIRSDDTVRFYKYDKGSYQSRLSDFTDDQNPYIL
jgi:hypothetical protein